jgi:hypothetical protein
MELVAGRPLRGFLEGAPLATRRLLEIAAGIAEGLAAAHAGGIVHRDLKPENIVVSADGFVKILDFGIAKLTAEQRSGQSTIDEGTAAGIVLGTVSYMSPEQAAGRLVDFRSDQFSLGSILYEMATGRRAFQKDTTAETMAAVIREEPPPIAQLNPKVPTPLRWVVERCLAKDADERYASIKDLARDLKSIRDHLSEASVAAPTPAGTTRPRRLAPLLAAAILGAALAAALLAALRRPAASLSTKYEQLTFHRGTLLTARFAPDGHTVLYGAAWEGRPIDIFEKREASPESRSLGRVGDTLLSVSGSGSLGGPSRLEAHNPVPVEGHARRNGPERSDRAARADGGRLRGGLVAPRIEPGRHPGRRWPAAGRISGRYRPLPGPCLDQQPAGGPGRRPCRLHRPSHPERRRRLPRRHGPRR